jgi:hypothetical protein
MYAKAQSCTPHGRPGVSATASGPDLSQKEFAESLETRGFDRKHRNVGTVYLGLGIASEEVQR